MEKIVIILITPSSFFSSPPLSVTPWIFVTVARIWNLIANKSLLLENYSVKFEWKFDLGLQLRNTLTCTVLFCFARKTSYWSNWSGEALQPSSSGSSLGAAHFSSWQVYSPSSTVTSALGFLISHIVLLLPSTDSASWDVSLKSSKLVSHFWQLRVFSISVSPHFVTTHLEALPQYWYVQDASFPLNHLQKLQFPFVALQDNVKGLKAYIPSFVTLSFKSPSGLVWEKVNFFAS